MSTPPEPTPGPAEPGRQRRAGERGAGVGIDSVGGSAPYEVRYGQSGRQPVPAGATQGAPTGS